MYTYTWNEWLTFFYLYCFFGWIFESTYVSLKQRRFVNRGFLHLPMLPLYGTGAVMMLWVSIPVQDSLFLTWCAGVAGATVLEYVTGYVMELLFKVRYWDYSNQRFNLHGYICLSSSIAWGFLTIFMTHLIHRPIERAILAVPLPWDLLFVAVVSVCFLYDSVISTREALAFGKSLEALRKLRQEVDILQVQTALLRMEAESRLEDARTNFLEQLEQRLGRRLSLSGLSPNKRRSDISLEELKARVNSRIEAFLEARGLSPDTLRGKTEQQLVDILREKEASLSSALRQRMTFGRKLFRSNPTAFSKKYAEEIRAIREYIKNNRT